MAGEFATGAARARGWRRRIAWLLVVVVVLSMLAASVVAVVMGALSG
jgi:hypothetical protein